MKWSLPLVLVAILLAAWAGIFWMTGRGSPASSPPSRPPRPSEGMHHVSPQQLTASGARSGETLGPLTAVAQDGKQWEWKELAAAQPVVVVFINNGCRCSLELEAFFHRLYRAYQGSVRFVGVINGPVETAQRYAAANRVPYLVLADPDLVLISRFRAESGGYVALVTPDGVLDTLWPGCSAEMIRELSQRIAELAGIEEQPVDTSGLPNALTTGCRFARLRRP
jgi:peroxiredoxin